MGLFDFVRDIGRKLFTKDSDANDKIKAEIEASLANLGQQKARVQIDPDWAPERIRAVLAQSGADIVAGKDPCVLPKARKNAVELAGIRRAHGTREGRGVGEHGADLRSFTSDAPNTTRWSARRSWRA